MDDRERRAESARGFTLVEAIVVVVIIGLLAALAVPLFFTQRTIAMDTAVKSDLRNVAAEVEATAVAKNGDYSKLFPGGREPGTALRIAAPGIWAKVARQTSPDVSVELGATPTSTDFCLVGKHGDGGSWWTYSKRAGGLRPDSAESVVDARALC